MREYWIAFALMACLAIAACGSGSGTEGGTEGGSSESVSPAVGVWVIDVDATMESFDAGKDPETPPQMAEMVKGMVKAMTGEMTVNADGTYVGVMEMANPMSGQKETQKGEGTWTLEGDQFSITTTKENGKPKENPDTETATLKDGRITISPEGGPFSIIFKKK